MSVVIHSLFSESYVAVPGTKRPELNEIISLDDVLVVMSKDLQNDVSAWEEKHFERIGMAEFAAKGDCGVGAEARVQAQSVGATLVLFSIRSCVHVIVFVPFASSTIPLVVTLNTDGTNSFTVICPASTNDSMLIATSKRLGFVIGSSLLCAILVMS